MPTLDITTAADALKNVLSAMPFTPAPKVYRWAPRRLDRMPAIVIDLPTIDDADDEYQIVGHKAWRYVFKVTAAVELNKTDVVTTQDRVAKLAQAIADAIHDNPTLNGAVEEANFLGGDPEITDDENRPIIQYVLDIEVVQLVLN